MKFRNPVFCNAQSNMKTATDVCIARRDCMFLCVAVNRQHHVYVCRDNNVYIKNINITVMVNLFINK